MNYKDEKKDTGHVDQLYRINRFTISEAKAKGVEVIDVSNRSGMHKDEDVGKQKRI